MQQATNCSRPLPFPTVSEAAKLKHIYNMAANRGCPSVPALNALVHQSAVEMKDIKAGSQTKGRPRPRGQRVDHPEGEGPSG